MRIVDKGFRTSLCIPLILANILGKSSHFTRQPGDLGASKLIVCADVLIVVNLAQSFAGSTARYLAEHLLRNNVSSLMNDQYQVYRETGSRHMNRKK